MKLVSVRLKNFRCYSNETTIHIGDLTALIGKNDCGKSTIMDALEIFFDEKLPDADDATVDGDNTDVRIICEFEDLPESLVIDANYPTDLASEYLLNDSGRLEIHKIYNCALKKPALKGVFARAIHPTTQEVSDLLLLKNKELKTRAESLNVDINDIDIRVNTLLRRQLWESVGDLQLNSTEIPLKEETAKQIWEQLKKRLPAYALFKSDRPSTDQDAEAQDPMKSAVKEAIKAKEDELAAISKFVEQEVKKIAKRTVDKIREMDPDLASQLNPRFTPPNWATIFKISLTGDGDIPINKRGSGVRRLILLNFFRAKAEQRAIEGGATRIIYAIEEPETSQHPFNQRMLLHALAELAEEPDCQVILSTHTPVLARLLPLEALRCLLIEPDGNRTICAGDDHTYELVTKQLGVLPDHDIKLFIGVEGENDINFLKNISIVLATAGEQVPNLTELEDKDQIMFIPMGGSNLASWKSRLARLNRPEFHLFDRDVGPSETPRYQSSVDEINARQNCVAHLTGKSELENYLHPNAITAARPVVQLTFGDYDDLPALVANAVHSASESQTAWDDLEEEKKRKKICQAKAWLNTDAVSAMTPELLDQADPAGDIRGWLNEIKNLLTN